MGTQALTHLFRAVAAEHQPVDAVFQERMLAHAINVRDWQIVQDMCQLTNLDPGVEARIGKLKDAKSRAAWIARPNRTPDEITAALRSESRVGVLVAALETGKVPGDLVDTIADRGGSKLSLAILESAGAGRSSKTMAAAWIINNSQDASYRMRGTYRQAIAGVCADDRELMSAIAVKVDRIDFLDMFASADLSEEAFWHIADRCAGDSLSETLVECAGEKAANRSYYYSSSLRSAGTHLECIKTLAANGDLPDAVRAWLDGRLAAFAGDSVLSALFADNSLPLGRQVRDAMASLAVQPLATSSGNPHGSAAHISELVDKAMKQQSSVLLTELLCNFALTDEQVAQLSARLDYATSRGVLKKLAQADNTGRFAKVAARWSYLLEDSMLEVFTDPSAALIELVKTCLAPDSDIPEYQRSTTANAIVQSRFWTTEAILLAPVSIFVHGTPAGSSKLPEYLVEKFGNDAGKWDLFESLCADGTMSVGDTVQAVLALR